MIDELDTEQNPTGRLVQSPTAKLFIRVMLDCGLQLFTYNSIQGDELYVLIHCPVRTCSYHLSYYNAFNISLRCCLRSQALSSIRYCSKKPLSRMRSNKITKSITLQPEISMTTKKSHDLLHTSTVRYKIILLDSYDSCAQSMEVIRSYQVNCPKKSLIRRQTPKIFTN